MSRRSDGFGWRVVAVVVAVLAVTGVMVPVTAAAPTGGGPDGERAGSWPGADGPVALGSVAGGPEDPAQGVAGLDGGAGPDRATGAGIRAPGTAATSGELVGPPGAAVDPAAGDRRVRNVTLVTGQRVSVVGTGNRTVYAVDAAVEMRRVETPRGTYVYPAGTDFDTFDAELFNVTRLVARGLTEGESGAIPVIVEYESPGAAGALGAGAGGLTGFEPERTIDSIDAVAGTVETSAVRASPAAALSTGRTVERVTLDRVVSVDLNGSTRAVGADAVRRERGLNGSGVRVAVLDSGVADHPDLSDAVVLERDFTRGGSDGPVADNVGHGTHVASIVAGDGTASNGTYVGVAPGASVMDLRVLDTQGRGSLSSVLAGVEFAVEHSADVISMSLGVARSGPGPLAEAVDAARRQGVVVVASAGNSGPRSRSVVTPALADGAIAVGAADHETGEVARFSSRGPAPGTAGVKPELLAPGVDIVAACPPGESLLCERGTEYAELNGTSMAAPHVSGVVAMVLQANPDWSPDRVEDVLVSTATPFGDRNDTVYDAGAGMVDATRAVDPRAYVENATVDFGFVGGNRTPTRTLTVHNRGDRPLTLSVAARSRNVTGSRASGEATVNRTSVTVPADGSADVELRVDPGDRQGAYSGVVTFSGGNRSYRAVFGYTRARAVTIEKRPLPGTSVEGDRVWVIPEDGSLGPRVLEVTDGTATYYAIRGSNYTVQSVGTDESTGVPVLMATTATRPTRITLDESRTVRYRPNVSELRARHGSLVNLSVHATLTTGWTTVSSLSNFTGTRTVRFGEATEVAAVTEYLLAPAGDHDGRSRHVDVPSLYHLVNVTTGVDGPETFAVNRSALAVDDRTYYRSTPDQRLRVIEGVSTRGRFGDDGYWWNLSGRTDQTVYYTPELARYGTLLQLPDRVEGYRPDIVATRDPDPGDEYRSAFNRHPFTPTLRFDDPEEFVDPDARFQVDQGPGRWRYEHLGVESRITVRVNGSRAFQGPVFAGDSAVPVYLPRPGTEVTVGLRATSPGTLSTRTVAEYRASIGGGDDVPPDLRRVTFDAANATSAVDPGETPLRVNFSEPVVRAVVLAAPGNVRSVPVDAEGVGDAAGWTRVETRRIDDTAFAARVDASTRRTSVAVFGVDEAGNAVAVTVFDAVRTPAAEPGGPRLSDYTDADGVVTTEGLNRAISDWVTGEVSTEFLNRVIRAWATGRTVE